MVDHPRLAVGPRRLAVHAGTGGTTGRAAFGEVGGVAPQPLTVILREGGGSSTPRLLGSIATALEYWIARSSAQLRTRRATTVVGVDARFAAARSDPSRPVQELQRVNR